jgi:hypothetical protein
MEDTKAGGRASSAMEHFRCYFINRAGHIIDARDIECGDQRTALDRARNAFAERPLASGFELWQGRQKLHHESRYPDGEMP